ncbi:MAG: GTPase HflX [Mariprofundales bacterium]
MHPFLPGKSLASSVTHETFSERVQEFQHLVAASSCNIVASERLTVRLPVAGTLLGKGQLEGIAAVCAAHEATVAFVDHPLTPVQQRNLEKAWQVKVVDRTGLILEIFAARAKTREGVLQVELASLNYQISRLVRSWTHLERQRGGFGFMGGPGERQIELDRRMIRQRINSVEKELLHVRQTRRTQRKGRQRREMQTIALVGYTNAGKSTLFNRLTQSSAYVANQLFATLDPTLRRLDFPEGGEVMLSDTVGFVQDLPHELVNAFSATLEEVLEADLILHVRDIASVQSRQQADVVYATLADLGLDSNNEATKRPPIVEVWNKIDLAPNVDSRILTAIDGSKIAVSARTGAGIDELLHFLRDWHEQDMQVLQLTINHSDGKTLAWCHEYGRVLHQNSDEQGTHIQVRLSAAKAGVLKQIIETNID